MRPTSLASIIALIVASATPTIADDFCTFGANILFNTWTISFDSQPESCTTDPTNNFQVVMAGQSGCNAITAFRCNQSGQGVVITFNNVIFCEEVAVSNAIQTTFGQSVACGQV
jgi:hypothetical protein